MRAMDNTGRHAIGATVARKRVEEALPMWITSIDLNRIAAVDHEVVVQHRACVDEPRVQGVVCPAHVREEEAEPTLPNAKGLLDKEARGRVDKVEVALLRLVRLVVRVEEDAVIVTRTRIAEHNPSRPEPHLSG